LGAVAGLANSRKQVGCAGLAVALERTGSAAAQTDVIAGAADAGLAGQGPRRLAAAAGTVAGAVQTVALTGAAAFSAGIEIGGGRTDGVAIAAAKGVTCGTGRAGSGRGARSTVGGTDDAGVSGGVVVGRRAAGGACTCTRDELVVNRAG